MTQTSLVAHQGSGLTVSSRVKRALRMLFLGFVAAPLFSLSWRSKTHLSKVILHRLKNLLLYRPRCMQSKWNLAVCEARRHIELPWKTSSSRPVTSLKKNNWQAVVAGHWTSPFGLRKTRNTMRSALLRLRKLKQL